MHPAVTCCYWPARSRSRVEHAAAAAPSPPPPQHAPRVDAGHGGGGQQRGAAPRAHHRSAWEGLPPGAVGRRRRRQRPNAAATAAGCCARLLRVRATAPCLWELVQGARGAPAGLQERGACWQQASSRAATLGGLQRLPRALNVSHALALQAGAGWRHTREPAAEGGGGARVTEQAHLVVRGRASLLSAGRRSRLLQGEMCRRTDTRHARQHALRTLAPPRAGRASLNVFLHSC